MANKQIKRVREYRNRERSNRSRQTGNINERNNNEAFPTSLSEEITVQGPNDAGIGDSGMNRDKLTNYTSNHSADA